MNNKHLLNMMFDDADNLIKLSALNNTKFHGKSILITGASGLIGLNFLAYFARLQRSGIHIEVTGIINSESNPLIEFFSELKYFKFIKLNLTIPSSYQELSKYDIIIHAASYGQPGRFLEDKLATLKLNTTCCFELFEKLEDNGIFLYISTSEIYSGNLQYPYIENQIGTTDPYHTRSCYIEGKRCGETITNIYFEKGVKSYSARLALAYGPGTKINDQRVLNQFIKKALLNGYIDLQDSGTALRTYCYVTDAIEIFINIIFNGIHPVYNVGGISKISILKLAQEIAKITNVKVILPENEVLMSDAPEDVSLDLNLIKKVFNKTDFIPIDIGLNKTVEWQRHLYG
jgi:UDP-glucuronate decarboxylase